MRFLVTGSNGLVGTRLVRSLASRGHEVIGLDRGAPHPTVQGIARHVSVDMTDAAAFGAALREAKADVVINCAAMTDVDGCEKDPSGAWAVNAEAVATLARSTRELGNHLVHVSTDYVFDGDAGPYDVDATPNPRGIYALSKHGGEQALQTIAPKGHWAIARTAVVYGWPSMGKNNFGSWLVEALGAGKPVKLFSDQWVSPSYAGNVAEMIGELGERKLAGLWHTSGSEVVDRVTFGKLLCAKFGFDASNITPSRMADVNLPSPRPAKSGLIVAKTAATLKTQPLTNEAALARLHTEYLGAKS
jgi:dTDP-4-dehydrorhamnose reductase